MRWRFTVLAGEDADRRHECANGDLVIIGASEQAHLRLADDPYGSGAHCLVETRGRELKRTFGFGRIGFAAPFDESFLVNGLSVVPAGTR